MHPQENGLRATKSRHKHLPDQPLVSIVTVVFNGAKVLEGTMQSVLRQTYDNIEYIVIDGGSTDDTRNIIQKYENAIDQWVSEPDRGIYDAMNKGISLASGEWINFMNAGDTFYQTNTIESIFKRYDPAADVLFGAQEVVYPDRFTVVKKARPLCDAWKGNICWHQSMFIKTAIMKNRPFDLSYKICADFDLLLYVFRNNHIFYDSGQTVARILLGGYSDSNLLSANNEKWRISKKHQNTIRVNLYFITLQVKTACSLILKRIFPRALTNAIISYLYK
jgi:glycosyltransferase involved in cell wall biosynthesis